MTTFHPARIRLPCAIQPTGGSLVRLRPHMVRHDAGPVVGHGTDCVALSGGVMLTQVPTPLIGREHELAGVRAELADPATRLLTLTGPVGAGKSRLAAAVVQSLLADGPLTLWTLDLAVVDDPHAALELARPADLPPAGRPDQDHPDEPAAPPEPGPSLLLLDNCDPVLARVPEQLTGRIAALLAADPGLRVLATSRES